MASARAGGLIRGCTWVHAFVFGSRIQVWLSASPSDPPNNTNTLLRESYAIMEPAIAGGCTGCVPFVQPLSKRLVELRTRFGPGYIGRAANDCEPTSGATKAAIITRTASPLDRLFIGVSRGQFLGSGHRKRRR